MKLETLHNKYPNSADFKFGDNESLCQRLLELVRIGKKTTTCCSVREYEEAGESLPIPGCKDIALNWDGTPSLVIETVEVTKTKFCDVDEAFALDEGENADLEGWRRDHKVYFERNGGYDREMMLVCVRFRLIEDCQN